MDNDDDSGDVHSDFPSPRGSKWIGDDQPVSEIEPHHEDSFSRGCREGDQIFRYPGTTLSVLLLWTPMWGWEVDTGTKISSLQ